jgi:undecaprenyl pyrophosphate phosphatase UppP
VKAGPPRHQTPFAALSATCVLNLHIDVDVQVPQKASVTELFPVSSLGHSVLIPALVGGSWAHDLSVSRRESPYLAFIVGLHVATAAALIIYFRHDWARIVTGFVSSLRDRTIATAEQKLAWMIVLATIPVGLSGLALEHTSRSCSASQSRPRCS